MVTYLALQPGYIVRHKGNVGTNNSLENLWQHRKLRMPIHQIIVLRKEGDGASADPTTVGQTCNRLNIQYHTVLILSVIE